LSGDGRLRIDVLYCADRDIAGVRSVASRGRSVNAFYGIHTIGSGTALTPRADTEAALDIDNDIASGPAATVDSGIQ